MVKDNKRLYEDLIAIRNQYPTVVTWLSERLENHKSALVRLSTLEDIKNAQGRAQEAADLLHTIQHAEERLR